VPGIPLRRRLFVLTATGILPLAVMAGVGLYVLAQQQRAPADRQLTLAAGYSMHVPKPVDPGELTAIIASVVGRSPA